MATNDLFEELLGLFLPVAFGRLAIASAGANRLFQQAIEAAADWVEPKVRSVPVSETEERPACVLHIVPLRLPSTCLRAGRWCLPSACPANPRSCLRQMS